jgi:hypothetical protein
MVPHVLLSTGSNGRGDIGGAGIPFAVTFGQFAVIRAIVT